MVPILPRPALILALLLLAAPAAAQIQPDIGRDGRLQGWSDRQGNNRSFYDPQGNYEGRSERSGGGGVQRFYDAEGRYLGRQDVERDFRQRRQTGRDDTMPQPPRREYDRRDYDRRYQDRRDYERRAQDDRYRPGYGYPPYMDDYNAPPPPLVPPRSVPAPSPGSGSTPWFGDDPQRPRGRTPWFGDTPPAPQPSPWR